eukprot:scaffold34436_cov50-Phaeocystis_antarctica.AAC.1
MYGSGFLPAATPLSASRVEADRSPTMIVRASSPLSCASRASSARSRRPAYEVGVFSIDLRSTSLIFV